MTREELEAMAELGGLSDLQFWVYVYDIQSVEFLLGEDVVGN